MIGLVSVGMIGMITEGSKSSTKTTTIPSIVMKSENGITDISTSQYAGMKQYIPQIDFNLLSQNGTMEQYISLLGQPFKIYKLEKSGITHVEWRSIEDNLGMGIKVKMAFFPDGTLSGMQYKDYEAYMGKDAKSVKYWQNF